MVTITWKLQARQHGRKAGFASIVRGQAFAFLIVFLGFSSFACAQAKPAAAAPAPAAPASSSTAAFESQMQAYRGLDIISDSLAKKVCSLDGVARDNGTVVIYDQTAFASLQAYAAFLTNAKIVFADYATLIPPDKRIEVLGRLEEDFKNQSQYYEELIKAESSEKGTNPDRQAALNSAQMLLDRMAQQAHNRAASAKASIEAETKHEAEAMSEGETKSEAEAKLEAKSKALAAATTTVGFTPDTDVTTLLSAIAVSSNVETPGQITIPDSNMAVALTRDIQRVCGSKLARFAIIYPPLFGKGSSSEMAEADLQAEIFEVNAMRSEAQRVVEEGNKDFINNYSSTQTTSQDEEDTTTDSNKKKGNAGEKPAGTEKTSKITHTTLDGANTLTGDTVLSAAFTDVNGLYDSFMNSLLTINAATGTSGSTAVIQGELLAKVLCGTENADEFPCETDGAGGAAQQPGEDADPYANWVRRPAFIVLASVANAGGTELDHKTFWTALSSGDKISYSGGAIVNVAVWKADSTSPIYADVLRYRVPFSNFADPKDAAADTAVEKLP